MEDGVMERIREMENKAGKMPGSAPPPGVFWGGGRAPVSEKKVQEG